MKKRRTSGWRKSMAAPHGVCDVGAEEARRIGGEIVPVRPEVVVDDVEEDHQAEAVRGVDQGLQIVGRAIGGVGREGQHAVVAPVALAREIVDRHELDGGDAELSQVGQPRGDTGEAAQAAGMQLVEHGLRAICGRASPDAASDRRADRRPGWDRARRDLARATRDRARPARRPADSDSARRPRMPPRRRTSPRRRASSARRRAFDLDRHLRLAGGPQAKARMVRIDQVAPNGRSRAKLVMAAGP